MPANIIRSAYNNRRAIASLGSMAIGAFRRGKKCKKITTVSNEKTISNNFKYVENKIEDPNFIERGKASLGFSNKKDLLNDIAFSSLMALFPMFSLKAIAATHIVDKAIAGYNWWRDRKIRNQGIEIKSGDNKKTLCAKDGTELADIVSINGEKHNSKKRHVIFMFGGNGYNKFWPTRDNDGYLHGLGLPTDKNIDIVSIDAKYQNVAPEKVIEHYKKQYSENFNGENIKFSSVGISAGCESVRQVQKALHKYKEQNISGEHCMISPVTNTPFGIPIIGGSAGEIFSKPLARIGARFTSIVPQKCVLDGKEKGFDPDHTHAYYSECDEFGNKITGHAQNIANIAQGAKMNEIKPPSGIEDHHNEIVPYAMDDFFKQILFKQESSLPTTS